MPSIPVTRRTLLATSTIPLAIGSSGALGQATSGNIAGSPASGSMPVTIKINGAERMLTLDPRTTLLDALREHLHLIGTKKGCDHGQCGACTVLVNGERINSCLSLALQHAGDEVTTIEGLGTPDKLHPMQDAFVEHDGYQCGYCTPGQICSAVAMLGEIERAVPSHVTGTLGGKISHTHAEIAERMSGNICRCGAYSNIAAAITDVAGA
jgi:xanthine dehydrogenase YagT iron-sulfur-binding subunit